MVERFEPAFLSVEENEFLAAHVGEAPSVAFYMGVPAKVNPKAVRPLLEKIYELEELKKNRGVAWAGLDAIKASCLTYVQQVAVWENAERRGAPYPPTMQEWDSRGRAHRGAIGSDSQYARTYFDANGARQPLGVDLVADGSTGYVPEWVSARKQAPPIPKSFTIDEDKGLVTCPLCGHVETFEAGVQSKRNMAMTRMSKHCLSAKKDTEDHRILNGNVVSGA